MKKNLSTRGAAALLALAMGYMGQGVAQAAYIQPKSAQPVEELEFDVNCFDMHFYYGKNTMGSLDWAECTGLITKDQVAELYNIDEWSLPNEVMTISRGRLLEHLYHLAGSPEVKNLPEKSPYTDLTPGDARYKVAIWATRVGLTTGWSDGSFHYDTPASRGAYFTFLYRAAGSPKVTLEPLGKANAARYKKRFAPIKRGSELHRAMSWAYQHAMAKREDYDLPMNFNYPSADYVTWDAYRVPDFYFASHRTIFIPLMILDSHEELAPIVARLQSLS
ncbi:S-layer homology domain-containing protein [Rothia mucilaginosa]|uniref:S-layer homology domain-containing protein n=1 Tax=Rothia mucilaginosa TaxID=43675 RepID=UPI00204A7DAC|nr:S-layer homology domain-containing protein [Rothia mucilaginosa]UQF83122.1 MAG: S-layer homology domain-containing protein [Rothia mucilaginosa]